ncbi:MAG: O-antigen ligase family protein [Clostridia bacterium]|nr:O-antigen ligase family protein [Clostridia bacterium]
MNKTQKRSRLTLPNRSAKSLLESSVIVTFFGRISAWIYRKLGSGMAGGIFTAYNSENEALKQSAAAEGTRRLDIGGRFLGPLKQKIARGFENSWILNTIRRLLDQMLCSPMKLYGLFLFSFALYSALVYIFRFFFVDSGEAAVDMGIVLTLVLMTFASVAMIASRHTLAEALLGSSVTCFFLFDVVGIRRESLENRGESDGRYNIAFIIGMLFGLATYVISPLWLLIGIAGCVAAYLVLISPEFGVLAILTLLPFAPTMGLVAAVLYTMLCFLLKVLCGKRSVKLDLLDGAVLVFALLMIGGGLVAVSRGSMKPMMVYVAFMVGYFLVVNLIRSREWLKRCVIGVIASCAMVALYGLYQNFFGTVSQTWQDSDMFSEIEGRVVSTFENPNVLAEYLIMCLPLMFAFFLLQKQPRARFAVAVCGVMTAGCLIYTWSRGAWLGFLIGMVIFLLMLSRHTMTGLLFGTLAIPFLPFVLPESITQRFLSIGNLGDSSTSYRVYIWQGVLNMLKEYWHTGIGIGNDSFKLVYPLYALSGIESAPHSHNLYLQITVELGVVGLIVFIAVLFLYAQSCFGLQQIERRDTRLLSSAVFCGLLSVLAQGMTDYIWYNYRVFLMFWLMLGLGAAVRRIYESTASEYVI